MKHVGRVERESGGNGIRHLSSFEPCKKTLGSKGRDSKLDNKGALIKEYLPCHYFGECTRLPIETKLTVK